MTEDSSSSTPRGDKWITKCENKDNTYVHDDHTVSKA